MFLALTSFAATVSLGSRKESLSLDTDIQKSQDIEENNKEIWNSVNLYIK